MRHAANRQDESVTPGLVVWEAWREPDPGARWRDELSTMEATRLMNEVRCFGRIAFQLVGRPLRRADVTLLVEHGARIGLGMRLAPGADPVTGELMTNLRDAGLQRLVLDDAQRPRSALLAEIARARELGLGVHVATHVQAEDLAGLGEAARVFQDAGVHVWQLSFTASGLSGGALEAGLRDVVALADGMSMQFEIAGAPQVRRLLAVSRAVRVTASPAEGYALLFVGADGSLQPSAELPIRLGNVRHDDIVDVFADASELCALRDPDGLHGKCAVCEFRYLCGGGSRARAYAATGDLLAPDPACSYEPERAAR